MDLIVGCLVDILTPPSYFQLKTLKALETANLFPLNDLHNPLSIFTVAST